jgi:hypothetical protein
MGYRDAMSEAIADARRNLLGAALVLGAHLDAREGDIDDEIIVRALCAFMDARACYLASLDARSCFELDSGPPSTHARHSVREVVRRFGLTG